MPAKSNGRKIRYAVVALGHIAQAAVLPAFKNAKRNSELVAFVSGDRIKREKLGSRYGVPNHYSYDRYEDCLHDAEVDAVYIALPNSMHCEFTVRAAEAGVHVLCEKPLAVTATECEQMIQACKENGVKLMTAYRLHFERANLEAVEIVQSGKIGEPLVFNSLFAFQVRPGDTRTQKTMGGGTLYDIGVYCINAARYLFRDEPVEVFATSVRNLDSRSREVDAITSGVLRFPKERLASFTTSFASASVATYHVLGTKGQLKLENAYEYASARRLTLLVNDKQRQQTFPARDEFGAELVYFSDCILKNRQPEPLGEEGLADVRIVEALYYSAASGNPVRLGGFGKKPRPSLKQEIALPPVKLPTLVRVKPPHRD